MSNVVSLRRSVLGAQKAAVPALLEMVSSRRRRRHDPFWLKENAELLQVLAATGAHLDPSALDPVVRQLGDVAAELAFFPQYYRLLLSIAVDLRDLGVEPVSVEHMADFIVNQNLEAVELSDMHRAEVRLLLRRAGRDLGDDDGLNRRLRAFAQRSELFALPNRRAAYDLTHIIFHKSDYGRLPISDGAEVRESLIFAGMVAWLEGNLDLLAEISIALRYAGLIVPELWSEAVAAAASQVTFRAAAGAPSLDDAYHQVLVLNWAASLGGEQGFAFEVPLDASRILHSAKPAQALTELSYALLSMGEARRPEWAFMRWRLWPKLSEQSRQRITALESFPEFERFFAIFARPSRVGGE